MDYNIASAFDQQTCCLYCSHIVICIYAANVFVLTFNSDNRYVV